MEHRRKSYVIYLVQFAIGVSVFFFGQYPAKELVMAQTEEKQEGAAKEGQPKKAPVCNVDELKKQLESVKEKEENFNKAVRDALKERNQLAQNMEKAIKLFRDELSPEEQTGFDKAVKKYNAALDDYDVALSKANADIANGKDPAKAKKDAKVDDKHLDMQNALDEMFKPIEAEEKKVEEEEALKKKEENKKKPGEGKEEKKEEPKEESEEPKVETKLFKMKGYQTWLKDLNSAFDKTLEKLTILGVSVKEVAKEKEELEKKLKEAEEKCPKLPKIFNWFIGYSYLRAPDETVKNLNGFDSSFFYNVKPWLAIGGEFTGAFGSSQIEPTTDASLHRFLYLFGPQFNFYPNDKVKVFVHPLVGGVHDSTTTIFGTTTTDAAASAFAMAFGGGVDVNLNKRLAVRPIQVDYLPTHFGGTWQNNYRISTGLVIRLAEKK